MSKRPLTSQAETKKSRKDQILASLGNMLRNNPGSKITTAALAREVGVSEAALYRHFPSKTRIFEAFIESVEHQLMQQIFTRASADSLAEPMIGACMVLLTYCEHNPGVARVLTGDGITGEDDRLRQQVNQFLARFEKELAQLASSAVAPEARASAAAFLLQWTEGMLNQFVRSGFTTSPFEEARTQHQKLTTLLGT